MILSSSSSFQFQNLCLIDFIYVDTDIVDALCKIVIVYVLMWSKRYFIENLE